MPLEFIISTVGCNINISYPCVKLLMLFSPFSEYISLYFVNPLCYLVGSLFYDAFSVTILYSVDDMVISE
jgi:hypothetical protein